MTNIDYNYIQNRLKKFNSLKEILNKNIFIDWFFIPKPHPLYLGRYKVFEKNSFYILLLLIKNLFKILILFFVKIFSKKNNFSQFNEINFDYMIISHHISNNNLFENDIYYKNISKILKDKKKKYFSIYLDHQINLDQTKLKNKKNYYFLSNTLTILDELYCIIHMIKLFSFYLKIKNFSYKEKLIILTEVLNSETLVNIRINFQLKKIFKKINFKFLITTFEGYNFEKIVFDLAKKKDPRIQNIGYQHAPVLIDHYSLFDFQKTNFYPDVIFTSGNYYKKIFEKFVTTKPIFIAGSSKLNKKNFVKSNKQNFCLVLPEGIISECKLLFDFTINYTKKFKNLNFIWRLHPLMKIDDILKKLKINKKDLNNIYFSNNTDEDYIKSRYCLYRGSTAIIGGLQNLCYPIYLNTDPSLNINPINDLQIVKNITSINDLNSFTNNFKNDLNEIDDKISDYFTEPTQKFIDFL